VEQASSLVVWGNRIVVPFSVGNRRYFLKEWPAYVESGKGTAFVLALQDCARDGGVPVPQVLETVEGRCVLNRGGHRFSLQEFVGEPYDPALGPRQIGECAGTLGVFHRAVKSAEIGGKQWQDDPFSYAMMFVDQAEERVPGHKLSRASKQHVLALLDEMRGLLEKAKQRAVELGWLDLPLSPIHGDYCQFNCRFKGNRVVGVVDWDQARLAPRLLDVVFAVNIGLGWSGSLDYYEDFLWRDSVLPDLQALVNWLAEYGQQAPPFSEEEIRLFPLLCAALWPGPAGGFEPKCEAEMPGCDAVVGYMRRLVDEADDISGALRASL